MHTFFPSLNTSNHPHYPPSSYCPQIPNNPATTRMATSCGGSGDGGAGGSAGPCGACKYLRRKCVKGCIFAPYFDTEQGAAHFAAVHRVFGAANASKLLLRIPPQRRFDAVVTLCYEALSRVRDPVYGCVSHIFSLQQQVVNLQAELAYIQARLATLQRPPPPSHHHNAALQHPPATISPASCTSAPTALPLPFDPALQQPLADISADQLAAGVGLSPLDEDVNIDGCCDLPALSREFVYKYFSGVKFSPTDH